MSHSGSHSFPAVFVEQALPARMDDEGRGSSLGQLGDGSETSVDSSRFKDLLRQLSEEHDLRISELSQANSQLLQELERGSRHSSSSQLVLAVPQEVSSKETRTPPPSGMGREISKQTYAAAEEPETFPVERRVSRLKTGMNHQVTDGSQEGFQLKAVWMEYTNGDGGSNFHYYVAAAAKGARVMGLSSRKSRSNRDLIGMKEAQPIITKCLATAKPGVVSPSGTYRMCWDLIGLVLILYDTFVIPLQAFEVDRNDFVVGMDWVTQIFWTLDMFQSFFTGYFKEGVQIMEMRKIVPHYLKTWFIIDLVVVGPEWFTSLSRDGFGLDGVGIGRILRLGRAMRVLRLLRLLKLRRIVDALLELVESEYTFTIINLLKLLFAIFVLNHVIACVWYLVGKHSLSVGLHNWFEMSGDYPDDRTYMYLTSLHWSLTQFTPASMNVSASNTMERITSILVLFFAMVAFSSIVGHITASMSHLQSLRGAQMKQFWMLRRYLKQRHIRRDLQLRITKFLEYKTQKEHDIVHSSSVLILDQLSEPLRKELSYETMVQWLTGHAFFSAVSSKMPVFMHRLCHSALTEIGLASGDFVFTAGHEAKQMYFVKQGDLEYMGLNNLVLEPPLQEKEAFVEAALWVVWRHMGDCKVLSPGELIGIANDVFEREMCLHHMPWSFCQMYALHFCERLNSIAPEELSDVMREEHMSISSMARKAVSEVFPSDSPNTV